MVSAVISPRTLLAAGVSCTLLTLPSFAQSPSPEDRAKATEERMTDEERFGLVHSLMVVVLKPDFSQERDKRVPESVPQIAGWVKGVPRLGVPDLLLTDAGLGITNPTPTPLRCR